MDRVYKEGFFTPTTNRFVQSFGIVSWLLVLQPKDERLGMYFHLLGSSRSASTLRTLESKFLSNSNQLFHDDIFLFALCCLPLALNSVNAGEHHSLGIHALGGYEGGHGIGGGYSHGIGGEYGHGIGGEYSQGGGEYSHGGGEELHGAYGHHPKVVEVVKHVPHVVKEVKYIPPPIPIVKHVTYFKSSSVGGHKGGHYGGDHGGVSHGVHGHYVHFGGLGHHGGHHGGHYGGHGYPILHLGHFAGHHGGGHHYGGHH
ncbi:hypothetical protein TNCT_322201 [Trichonephila clavata]|uniref:Uncharacterized protein n=1 Tax=Trichonephila clavata TaxID=2740835 RepID=A0A8X6G1R4_TRICU|nr:hypothetical protein TNCT_322201 [Trichonephila clavata]